MLKNSNLQSLMVSNRFILGIVAFSISFGLSLVPNWDFSKALITGIITVISTYAAALFVDKRRRNYEMLILGSLRKRIKEREGLKSRIVREIDQIQEQLNLLYIESQHLQNQVAECRNQRDILNRELSTFASQKKQIETEISSLKNQLEQLEQSQTELTNSCNNFTAEKRRLELNCNLSRAEITQLQSQISEFQQEKKELESNLILLNRLKPQLDEKLHDIRNKIQELEIQNNQETQLFITTKNERENLEASLNLYQTQIVTRKTEITELQGQVSLLQEERDTLQNHVWDLLQQLETINTVSFSEISEPLESLNSKFTISENLPEEWTNFLEKLPGHEIQVLKAIIEQDNSKAAIKQIAEANITMPNLLIDSINERANDMIGELIIEPTLENPEIYQEHMINVKKMIAIYEYQITKHTSSN